MENSMQIFKNDEFGSIRTMLIDGEPWFVGNDVAAALGYVNPRKALSDHVDEEDKNTVTIRDGIAGNPNKTAINESGLYSLILSSKLTSAKKFKRWVTLEILPSIRKHGGYLSDDLLGQILDDPAVMEKFVQDALNERCKTQELEELPAEALPKAAYFDAYVDPSDTTNIRNTARELGIPQKRFCQLLIDWRLLYRDPSHRLMPYSKAADRGYFVVKDFYKNGRKGCYTLITAKGKAYIYKRLVKDGFLCLTALQ